MSCDNCGNKFREESVVMILDKANKRLVAIIAALVALWFSTIGLFVWYLNQYDFISYEQDGKGVNIIGDSNGVEYYGSDGEGTGAE